MFILKGNDFMYCNQCGNLIPDNGLFCTFCGAKAEGNPSAPTASVTKTEEAAAFPAAVAVHSPAAISENLFADGIIPAEPTQDAPEKYYTTKHIVLCLVIAGIMAAAAGVFAGLYYSLL